MIWIHFIFRIFLILQIKTVLPLLTAFSSNIKIATIKRGYHCSTLSKYTPSQNRKKGLIPNLFLLAWHTVKVLVTSIFLDRKTSKSKMESEKPTINWTLCTWYFWNSSILIINTRNLNLFGMMLPGGTLNSHILEAWYRLFILSGKYKEIFDSLIKLTCSTLFRG